MKKSEKPLWIAPRSRIPGIAALLVSLFAFGAATYLSRFFDEWVTDKILILGYAVLFFAVYDLIKLGPRFIISTTYFACNNVGSIGRVDWCEVKVFSIRRRQHTTLLTMEPLDSVAFWKKRRGPAFWFRRFCYYYCGNTVPIGWQEIADSPEKAQAIMNSYVPGENKLT